MIPRSLEGFIQELYDATDNSDVEWQEGAENTFFCNRNKYTIFLSHFFDQYAEENSFRFKITSKDKEANFIVFDHEADYKLMSNLFGSVQINAQGFGDISKEFFR